MRMLQNLVVVVISAGMLVGSTTAAHSVASTGAQCDVFDSLRTQVQDLESASAFDAKGYKKLGKNLKKASKDAPKEIKSAMKRAGKFYTSVGKAKNEDAAVDTYGSGLEKYSDDIAELATYLADNCAGSGGSSTGGSGKGGTLTLGDETIELESSRCFLQEQEAAGQKILLTWQAEGTNAAGEKVMVDFTRYDASSQFAGDDLSISVGDPFSGDAVSYSGRYDSGTIERSGNTFSASGIQVRDEQLQTVPASFELDC